MKCKNCVRYVHVNEDNERTVGKPNWCFYISDSPCPDLERECGAFTPLRNADRIRAMSDEELAKMLFSLQVQTDVRGGIQSVEDWMKYLSQEYQKREWDT